MPTYQYHCDSCGKDHEEFRPITAKGPKKCPHCGATEKKGFLQVFGVPNAIVRGLDSCKTFGQAAEENARRVGREQLEFMAAEDKARVSNFKGKLPKGATPNTVGTGATPPWRDGSMGAGRLDKPLDLGAIKNPKKYVETGATD